MKRFFYIIAVLFAFTQNNLAQTIDFPATEYTQDPNANFRLYKTKNMYSFIKLDTRTGQMELVQWSLDGNRMSYRLSNEILTSSFEEQIPGRFTLYATTNIYQFVLLDQIDGRTWHVQWGTDKEYRWIKPILFNEEIEELKNDNDIVSIQYKKRLTNKIQKVDFLYKRKKLSESTINASFRSLVNQHMRSNNKKDWISIEQACIVMKKIAKSKTDLAKKLIERDLEKATSIEDIETIFMDYVKKLD